jgi:hypothetical protein
MLELTEAEKEWLDEFNKTCRELFNYEPSSDVESNLIYMKNDLSPKEAAYEEVTSF